MNLKSLGEIVLYTITAGTIACSLPPPITINASDKIELGMSAVAYYDLKALTDISPNDYLNSTALLDVRKTVSSNGVPIRLEGALDIPKINTRIYFETMPKENGGGWEPDSIVVYGGCSSPMEPSQADYGSGCTDKSEYIGSSIDHQKRVGIENIATRGNSLFEK